MSGQLRVPWFVYFGFAFVCFVPGPKSKIICGSKRDFHLKSLLHSSYLCLEEAMLTPNCVCKPGFRVTFEELCTLIIDTAVLVARACDQYAVTHIEDYESGYLERVVKGSTTTKARLLHYFPPAASSKASQAPNFSKRSPSSAAQDPDSWCATHIDRKCLFLMHLP